jgi:O-antigen/teichoic acid export membrane protein
VALVLPLLIGLSQFGFFTAGALIANRLMVIPDALCTAAYPALVNECARGRRFGGALMMKYLLIAGGGGTAVALIGVAAADVLGHILFPGHSAMFAVVVRITIWSLPLISVEAVMGYALNAAGREADQARVSVPAAGISLLGSVALVLAFGLVGASWAMLLRTAVRSAYLLPVVIRTFRTSVDSEHGLADALDSATLLRKAG